MYVCLWPVTSRIWGVTKLDSNPRKRDSNRLKTFWLLENGFESLKEGFESLRHFFTTKNLFGNRDSNRLTQKCMNAPENARKYSTNTQFHSSYEHITQKDLTNMNV